MKTSKQIVTEHFIKPSKKLRDLYCIKKIISDFPKALVDAILYTNIKNNTLVIFVTSGAFKQEFDNKSSLLKTLAKMLRKADELCDEFYFEQVKVYFEFQPKEHEKKQYILVYEERADAHFENLATSPSIAQKIEEIRAVIQESL